MTAHWTGENAEAFSTLVKGIEARYSSLSRLLASPDMGLDVFHLEALHSYAGTIYERIAELAVAPLQEREKLLDLLFSLQWLLAYFRERHLRPFTCRVGSMLIELETQIGERPCASVVPLFGSVDALPDRIRDRLRLVRARAAEKKASGLAVLAESCLHTRNGVEAMAAGKATPLAALWAVSTAADRMGWWIDQAYSWLHPLAMKRIHQGGGTKEQMIYRGIKMKADEWQKAKERVEALGPPVVDPG